ncbi:hypothetical protein V6N13_095485 [Hibiscus sabdariffa]|uniref:Transducin/WD40 repeat-like superfamily protein n=2 Tax=Hibiscus sabdariffa TaxID=183260 RepID=A0ABR2PRH5_9ROSI
MVEFQNVSSNRKAASMAEKRARIERKIRPQISPQPFSSPHALLFRALHEDESKHLMHLNLQRQLDDVRWNVANQDEVACTSVKSNEVLVFDIGYVSSKPVEVLRTRRTLSLLGSEVNKGLCAIAFTTTDDSRLIASDTHGVVNIWDRRKSPLPCLELVTGSRSTLNTIQPHVDNQTIFGASKDGNIYMWDLRGGRASAAFQCHNEAGHPPLVSLKLASMLSKIGSLKAQSDIVPKEIHSINLDPSCPYQLAFHLDDGWCPEEPNTTYALMLILNLLAVFIIGSGVLDIYNLRVTHVHCPPPAWLTGASVSTDLLYLRKPSWLPASSIYAVGSSYDCGLHILDFYPDTSSPSHVDSKEEAEPESLSEMNQQRKKNIFVPLSEGVTACASHPLNGTIIAGTKVSVLSDNPVFISIRHCSSFLKHTRSLYKRQQRPSKVRELVSFPTAQPV